jgi:hypothetical protein
MRLDVTDEERAAFLHDLEGTVKEIGATWSRANGGRAWDEYSERNGHDIAILVNARDDLRRGSALEAPRRDLELLITRIRAGTSYGLRIAARTIPGVPSLNSEDPERVDENLDMLTVCDSLLARLLGS